MDTLESTFVLLVPPKPWLGGLKLEIKEWSELIGMMADYKLVTGADTTNQGTQIETDDRLGSLSSKATQTSLQGALISSQTQVRAKDLFKSGALSNGSAQTNPADFLLPVKQDKCTSYDISLMTKKYKTEKAVNVNTIQKKEKIVKNGMRNSGVNVNMNIVRPIQRPVDYKEVKCKVESKLGCRGGSKIKRLTLEDYKERRRALFEGKKHNEEKGSQTDNHHRMLFKAQMDFLDCHLKRLKNLTVRMLHERPSKYLGFASEYIAHITDITRQLASEDLALLMARDKEKVDEMKENPFWVWTSGEVPSERFRNGSAGRNDQLKSGEISESHDVSCSNQSYIVDGREGIRAEGDIGPQPFDKRRDEEHHCENDFSTESELRKHIVNLPFCPPDWNRIECNARNEYWSCEPSHHEETELSDRGIGVPNCEGRGEIPTAERRHREPNQINHQEHEPLPYSGNSRDEESSRCLDPRRPHFDKKHFQGRTAFSKPVEDHTAFSKPVEDHSVSSEPHQYLCGDRPLNSQRVPFGSDSLTPEKENRGASTDRFRICEERESINHEVDRPHESLNRDGERPRDGTNVQNDQDGYRRDGHKPHHNRVDRLENGESGGRGRKRGSLRRLITPIPHTKKPLLQRKYSPQRESARRRSRSPPSKVPRQGNQRYRPAHEDRGKHATPTKFQTPVKKAQGKRKSPNFEPLGKRKWPPKDPILKRVPRNQSSEKESSQTARTQLKLPPRDSLLKRVPRSQSSEKESSSTARPQKEAPESAFECSLFGDKQGCLEEWRSGEEKRRGGRGPPHSKDGDQSTDSDQFPFSEPD